MCRIYNNPDDQKMKNDYTDFYTNILELINEYNNLLDREIP